MKQRHVHMPAAVHPASRIDTRNGWQVLIRTNLGKRGKVEDRDAIVGCFMVDCSGRGGFGQSTSIIPPLISLGPSLDSEAQHSALLPPSPTNSLSPFAPVNHPPYTFSILSCLHLLPLRPTLDLPTIQRRFQIHPPPLKNRPCRL